MNIWVAVADSGSLRELIHSLRYGGHGLLWPVSVYAAAQVVPHPFTMQFLHAAIATAGVWLVFRFSPLPPRETLLFGFGYYLCFEYAIISRHYALGALCLAAALACLTGGRRPRYLLAAAALALLAQTTVYGLILCAAVAAASCVVLRREASWAGRGRQERVALGVAAAVLLMSAAAAAVWLRPPADGAYAAGWNWMFSGERATSTLASLWRAFVPVPIPGLHFWNTNLLDPFPAFAAAGGLLLAGLATWRLRTDDAALTCWAVGAGGLLLFAYTKYPGSQRHHGQLFLVFMAGCWLQEWGRNRRAGPDGGRVGPVRPFGVWVGALLAIQCAVGLYASAMDLAYPFSASQAAAAYIRENRLDAGLIVADTDSAAVPVVGRLDHPRVFYPRCGRTQRLVVWDERRKRPFPEQDFLSAVREAGLRSGAPVLALTSYPLSKVPAFLEPVAHFAAGIVADECYDLYRFVPAAEIEE